MIITRIDIIAMTLITLLIFTPIVCFSIHHLIELRGIKNGK